MKGVILHMVKVLLLFFLYFYSAKIGLTLDPVSGFASYVWLPTGISLAFLFIFGIRFWPGVFLGAFFANYVNNAPMLVAIGIAVGNTLEAVVGVSLLRKVRFNKGFESSSDVLKLLFYAAFLSTLISATIGSLSLYFGNVIPPLSILNTWIAWWVGDMVSDIIIAPLIFIWVANFRRFNIPRNSWFELTFLVFSSLFIGTIIFRVVPDLIEQYPPLTYLVFPPLIWAAIRFNQLVTISIIFIFSFSAVWATIMGHGIFVRDSLSSGLYYLQSFMGVTAITSMILSSTVSQMRDIEMRKDNFVSMVGHELKNPLASMKIFVGLEQKRLKEKKDDIGIKNLKKINNGTNRLIKLVNDLLDVSRLQSQRFELNKEPFSLATLLNEVVEDVQATTSKHTIVLRHKVHKLINADRGRIEQVLVNLLTNAIKYSPVSSKIYLDARSNKQNIIISVRDSGIGIENENLDKIFGLFYRVRSDNVMPGFGIGLYVTYRIVKQHGGRMWVKSKKGKGSTFFVSLPV